MSIICIVLIILIIFDKQFNNNFFKKQNIEKNVKIRKVNNINIILKLISVVLLFIINLRFMIPNGEASAVTSNTSVLFVIDTTVSMKALDYNGNKERFEGVINDCCYIVDELSTCKFSIITFGDTAQRLIPYTTDTDMVQAELKAISLENNYFAKGSSMNIVKDIMEETLRKEYEKNDEDSNLVVFFISDGEITTEEKLETFTEIKKYVNNGAVLGYGTQDGGKMLNNGDEDEPDNPYSYIYYYDDKEDEGTIKIEEYIPDALHDKEFIAIAEFFDKYWHPDSTLVETLRFQYRKLKYHIKCLKIYFLGREGQKKSDTQGKK